jgi:hypothetical protein
LAVAARDPDRLEGDPVGALMPGFGCHRQPNNEHKRCPHGVQRGHVGRLFVKRRGYPDMSLTPQEIAAAIVAGSGRAPDVDAAINALVTPHAGGGQASATQLAVGVTPVAIPGGALDSLQLPAAVAPALVMLFVPDAFAWRAANKAIGVFAKQGTSDTINGDVHSSLFDFYPPTDANVWNPHIAIFSCAVDGAWSTNLQPD